MLSSRTRAAHIESFDILFRIIHRNVGRQPNPEFSASNQRGLVPGAELFDFPCVLSVIFANQTWSNAV